MCLFSIIIPTYNSALTIGACIESITQQTLTDYEILVIDGLSGDDTAAIVKKYTESYPIWFYAEKDNGIYDAMNKGVDMAKGKWLYFLGSDDELYNQGVLASINILINNHPESAMIYGDVLASDGTLETYCDYTYPQLLGRCICHQSIFYHRSLFQKLRYDLRYKVCADWDLNLKIFRDKIKPLYARMIIAKFNLGGVSGRWWEHPEYLAHFANKKKMIMRYRGITYLMVYAFYKIKQKISA